MYVVFLIFSLVFGVVKLNFYRFCMLLSFDVDCTDYEVVDLIFLDVL